MENEGKFEKNVWKLNEKDEIFQLKNCQCCCLVVSMCENAAFICT